MFDNKASHKIRLPSKMPGTTESTNLKYLLKYLCDELMTDTRKELFVLDGAMYEFYSLSHLLLFSVMIPPYIYTGPTTMCPNFSFLNHI